MCCLGGKNLVVKLILLLCKSKLLRPLCTTITSLILILHSSRVNPLTTKFFPPRQHIFMHSAHATFVGTPLPQHSLLSGQTWWGLHTWRDPFGNTVNDIHDPPQAQQSEVKVGCQPIFAQHFPKLGPDLTDGTPYTTNFHVFLRPWVGSMLHSW